MPKSKQQACCGPNGCGPSRRDFLRAAGLGATAAIGLEGCTHTAGPFTAADFESLIPPHKKLDPQWVRALARRGAPQTYRGAELDYIGMPIGGVCAGQLYLGGDGKLWRWDIFNQVLEKFQWQGPHYAKPMKQSSPLEQGFAIRVKREGKSIARRMDRTGFRDIAFRGEYPIATVRYRDLDMPIEATLEAFSPFIPLDLDNSSLPATTLTYTFKNTSNAVIELEWCAWLENAVCLESARATRGLRRNRIGHDETMTWLECGAEQDPQRPDPIIAKRFDFGSMALAILGEQVEGNAACSGSLPDAGFDASQAETALPFGRRVIGALRGGKSLAPAESMSVTVLIAWHFPNLTMDKLPGGRYYATRFQGALDVVQHLAKNFSALRDQTRLWRDTWYDSTLPYWFLDRSFATTATLATATCHWFGNGRFYGWEGVNCCEGTCTHVWQYAQSVARLFPSLERSAREFACLDAGFNAATGAIGMRAEFDRNPATDGHAGSVLRMYREHRASADDAFLKRNWSKIRHAIEWLLAQDDADGKPDGLIGVGQPNTMDSAWFGPMAWISGLYVAALRAGEAMAREMGDEAFAQAARTRADLGSEQIAAQLWNGEYFIHKPDPAHPDAQRTGEGCWIEQVYGDHWTHMLGLGRILPDDKVRKALQSLWRYNYTPDVGPFRRANKGGRWYAMPGEGGLVMCSFPKGKGTGIGGTNATFVGYFNECMTGFEYQVAAHMMWDGMVTESLALVRSIHDRYHASRRNPWNEVECADHYARAMMSYGVYLAASGFEYHGPKGHIGFAPRMTPHDFRCAFTAAESWGAFHQKDDTGKRSVSIAVKYGVLRLNSISLAGRAGDSLGSAHVALGLNPIESTFHAEGTQIKIALAKSLEIRAGETLEIQIA